MMQILVLLGINFDAMVVFVTNSSLFFRLAVAILCQQTQNFKFENVKTKVQTKVRLQIWCITIKMGLVLPHG